MPTLTLKDFGPIAEASIDLKPLTVFMGPNGTGKSYAALAWYALSRSLAGDWMISDLEDTRHSENIVELARIASLAAMNVY